MLYFNKEELMPILRDFSNLTGIMLVVFDAEKNNLCHWPSENCGICGLARRYPELRRMCHESDVDGFRLSDSRGDTAAYTCHMGLTEAIAPITGGGGRVGYLMLGQVLLEDDRERVLAKIAEYGEKYGVDADGMRAALDTLRPRRLDELTSAVSIMRICAGYLWMKQIVNTKNGGLAFRIERFIIEELRGSVGPEEICRAFGISRSALYKLSKEQFGVGISDHIRLLRMREAERLLRTGLPVGAVSEAVGIPDASYFTKLYRQYSGSAPKKYQRDAD